MADSLSARQQIIDKIKDSSNILVTVSRNPSVDELSAALGLTLMLNKLNKHATAIMSGDVPSAIEFLAPEKTFENTVDSLRDFIIALDKEKADHLRYKVDGDVVKIFITPYRTTISQDDLDFSQGDYNVELVLALAVKDESDLDAALEAHGQILHDAVVATIDNEGEPSKLGSIDWRDTTASSVSEMLVSLSEAIKNDKAALDEQISTALLTGIVAATDRFSNDKTSSKVMTMAAQLMAAGANQQLIAAKLEEAHEIGATKAEPADTDEGTSLTEGESSKIEKSSSKKAKKSPKAEEPKKDDGTLAISHEKSGDLDTVAEQVAEEKTEAAVAEATDALDEVARETASEQAEDAALAAEQKLAQELQATIPGSTAPPEPLFGGTLNATSEQAAEDKRREEEADRNRTLLTHGETGHVSGAPQSAPFPPPFNATQGVAGEPASVDPFAAGAPVSTPVDTAEPVVEAKLPTLPPLELAPNDPVLAPAADISTPFEPTPLATPAVTQTLADIDASVREPHEEARAAVEAAFEAAPPVDSGLSPLEAAQTAAAPVAELPPLPDFSTLPPPLPPVPPAPGEFVAASAPAEPAPFAVPPVPAFDSQPPSNDPGQFKIPGQN